MSDEDIRVNAGDDGLTDDERRLKKQSERDAEQAEIDRKADQVRADMERANGEAEGSRGRNVAPAEKPAKASPRKSTGNTSTNSK